MKTEVLLNNYMLKNKLFLLMVKIAKKGSVVQSDKGWVIFYTEKQNPVIILLRKKRRN